jgi:AraC-like DNA-binding protein
VLFQYTLAGRGAYAEGGRTCAVGPGEGFIVLLPSAHRYRLPPDSLYWTFFWFIVRHPVLAERIRRLRREEAAVQRWDPGSAALEQAVALIAGACHGRLRDVWSFEERLFSWLLETERELHRRRYPEDERHLLLEETRRAVREHLPRPLGTIDLAEGRGLERTTFCRRFKAGTGLTPAAFMTEVRLEEARKLLRSPAKIEAIARQTGFADANHFCKVFRRHLGTSPGAYRRIYLRG